MNDGITLPDEALEGIAGGVMTSAQQTALANAISAAKSSGWTRDVTLASVLRSVENGDYAGATRSEVVKAFNKLW